MQSDENLLKIIEIPANSEVLEIILKIKNSFYVGINIKLSTNQEINFPKNLKKIY